MNPVNIQPLARAEAEQAALWYESQRPGLGIEFILELDAALEIAAQEPETYQLLFGGARRVLLRRFPYADYFIFDGETAEVFGVLHQHRAPAEWRRRTT